ncbi:MAG TPA: hypothetical protein DDY37_08210 [Legionella sp.]|nr:hypothetical protein [Legionella sp.]
MIGTLPEAVVSHTSVWQLAFLSRAEAYSCPPADRSTPFLRQIRIVDDRLGIIITTNLPVSFGKPCHLQWGVFPDAIAD